MPLPQTEVLPQAGRLLLTDLAYLPASFQPGPSCAGTLGSQCKVGKHTQLVATPLAVCEEAQSGLEPWPGWRF